MAAGGAAPASKASDADGDATRAAPLPPSTLAELDFRLIPASAAAAEGTGRLVSGDGEEWARARAGAGARARAHD
jgi:hypothetical protein